ncbi:Rhs family protein, partial [Paenibacillus alvei TS-15]
MKKWLSMILACALLFTSTPLTSAQDSPKSSNQSSNMTVTSSVYGSDESLSDSEELITITSLTEMFGVARDWVVNEIVKGYQLHHPTLITDPLHAHNASVTAAVYDSISVTDQVYGQEDPLSVTDLVYNTLRRAKRSLSDDSPYDKVALQRAPIRLDQAPYAVGSDSDHISTVDASLRVEATDLVMPGANGLDFALRRVYDSSRAKNDITFNPGSYKENITKQSTDEEGRFKLGKGWIWDISYFKRVDGQMYLYISGLGTYRIDGSNIVGYPFHDLNFSESENVKIGSEKAAYELANYKTGVRQYFNAVGDLILIKDKDGNYIQFIYHGTVLGIVVTSNSSKTNANAMIFTYNPDNTIVVESGGRTVVYKKQRVTSINGESVLEQDLLTEVIDPMGRSTKYNYSVWKDLFFNFARDHKDYRKYGQSDLMRMKWGRNDTIALSVIEHPTKAITRLAFDTTVFRKIGEYAEEETIRYKTRRDSYSSASGTHQNELIFTFNNGDVGKEFKDNSFSVDVTDGLKTTTYVYDKRYNGSDAPSSLYLEETRTRTDSGNEARTVRYQYDRGMRNPNPIRIEEVRSSDGRNSAPRITTRTYDGENWGYIVSEKNPLGATSRYEYGRLESPNKRKGLIRSDVPTGQSMILRSEYQYDRSTGGLLQVQSKNEQGTIVQQLNYEYDPMGNPITIRIKGEPRDTVIQQEFSPEFRTMFLNKQSVNVTNVDGAPDSIVSRMEYNTSTGDPTKYIDGNGNETKYTHDKLGRMTAEIYADGTQTAVAYDDAANKITITYPNGQQIEKWFDPLGNLIKETNGRGGLARHTYDRYGHMIRKGTFDDNWIEYEYDAWGRVTKENFIYGQNRTIYDDAANTK